MGAELQPAERAALLLKEMTLDEKTAYLQVSAEIQNERAENQVVEVTFELLREDGEAVKASNGLDDHLMAEQMKKAKERLSGGLQNADISGKGDLLWEEYTEALPTYDE